MEPVNLELIDPLRLNPFMPNHTHSAILLRKETERRNKPLVLVWSTQKNKQFRMGIPHVHNCKS
jgi:hypothetical protein